MHDSAYYESRVPIKDLGPVNNFLRFIWDDERKAFLDRTARDWAVLGLFYLCFFGVLFSLFALQMWIALGFVGKLDKPYMQHSSKIFARTVYETSVRSFMLTPIASFDNPGLGFVPNILCPETSPIVWVSATHAKSEPKQYIRAIRRFLDGYKRNESRYDTNCSDGKLRSNVGRKPCFFNIDELGPCSVAPYGYVSPYRPCVLLKFNKRFDWVPVYYNQSSELPESMPFDLRTAVRASQQFRIWLSCAGASNVDKEHLGEIEYYPAPGFPVEFFPFMGQPEYLAPVVGLVFKNPTAVTYLWPNPLTVGKSNILDLPADTQPEEYWKINTYYQIIDIIVNLKRQFENRSVHAVGAFSTSNIKNGEFINNYLNNLNN